MRLLILCLNFYNAAKDAPFFALEIEYHELFTGNYLQACTILIFILHQL